jgi:hypothetical protein
MVGMGVGVERGHQLQVQFPDQGEIALVLLEHRIDQQRPATGHIGEQVGEGAGLGVEELAEQQRPATGGCDEGEGRPRGNGHGSERTDCYDDSRIKGNNAARLRRFGLPQVAAGGWRWCCAPGPAAWVLSVPRRSGPAGGPDDPARIGRRRCALLFLESEGPYLGRTRGLLPQGGGGHWRVQGIMPVSS